MSRLPNRIEKALRSTRTALAWLGRIRKSTSAEYREIWPRKRRRADDQILNSPGVHTDKFRKSLLKGIGVGSLAVRRIASAAVSFERGKGIGGIGFLKGVENTDHFLHSLILRQFVRLCPLNTHPCR
jgi:hypothetical protein